MGMTADSIRISGHCLHQREKVDLRLSRKNIFYRFIHLHRMRKHPKQVTVIVASPGAAARNSLYSLWLSMPVSTVGFSLQAYHINAKGRTIKLNAARSRCVQ